MSRAEKISSVYPTGRVAAVGVVGISSCLGCGDDVWELLYIMLCKTEEVDSAGVASRL